MSPQTTTKRTTASYLWWVASCDDLVLIEADHLDFETLWGESLFGQLCRATTPPHTSSPQWRMCLQCTVKSLERWAIPIKKDWNKSVFKDGSGFWVFCLLINGLHFGWFRLLIFPWTWVLQVQQQSNEMLSASTRWSGAVLVFIYFIIIHLLSVFIPSVVIRCFSSRTEYIYLWIFPFSFLKQQFKGITISSSSTASGRFFFFQALHRFHIESSQPSKATFHDNIIG